MSNAHISLHRTVSASARVDCSPAGKRIVMSFLDEDGGTMNVAVFSESPEALLAQMFAGTVDVIQQDAYAEGRADEAEEKPLACKTRSECKEREARDGGVMNLTCSVALYPSSSDVSALAKLVQEDASVSIEGPPDLFAASPSPAATDLTPPLAVNGPDALYSQAVEVVRSNRKASISLVQRHLRIGYNRAAQLLESMEQQGVISPMDKSGARKILAEAA